MEVKKMSFGFMITKEVQKSVAEEKKEYVKSLKVVGGEEVKEMTPLVIPMKPNTLITAERLNQIAAEDESVVTEPETIVKSEPVETTNVPENDTEQVESVVTEPETIVKSEPLETMDVTENETEQMAVRELMLMYNEQNVKKEIKTDSEELIVPVPSKPVMEDQKEVWRPPATPELASPAASASSSSSSRPKPHGAETRRRLGNLNNDNIAEVLMDSGSEGESDLEELPRNEAEQQDDELWDAPKLRNERKASRILREKAVLNEEECQMEIDVDEVLEESVKGATSLKQPSMGQEYEGLDVFSWSEDFSTFSSQEETYLRSPGPKVESQDPVDIFMSVWDESIMEEIVRETNRYAWQFIAPLAETVDGVPEFYNSWTETTVSEMYRYFALLILMSLCNRVKETEYWETGTLEMPKFRAIMSRTRFLMITKFLHFVNNDCYDIGLSAYEKKISKIRPILDHCNRKFVSLYTPNKHLSLDESLLLCKGRLSRKQCIRTKADCSGIKSYELCEAVTGYQLRCLLYAGEDFTMSEGFESCTAKVVLELMDGFLDVGHTLVMEDWYNQLPLARFLKRRHTDVIGTLNPSRVHVPNDIKLFKERSMAIGEKIARHCGDISLVAWKDVKLVTTVSTYHRDRHLRSRRAGFNIAKPKSIVEYYRYMGGVASKDQVLSLYLLERKICKKWYLKVYKRLLNISLFNAYIIFTKNKVLRKLTHRDFRRSVADGLASKFADAPEPPALAPVLDVDKDQLRLMWKKGEHLPSHTDFIPGKKCRRNLRCRRCTKAGRRTMVTSKCTTCDVPLCLGVCYDEYHRLPKL